jgi:LacI family transcriptional regulator
MVSPKTRLKVEAIIKELDYKPNYFARGLMRGSADSVGILVYGLTDPYYAEIIDAIENILVPQGIYPYICDCKNNVDAEKKYTDELIRRNVDALIVIETISLNTKKNYFIENSFNCPVILINQHLKPHGDAYVVRCDQSPGIIEAFEYVRENKLFPFLLLLRGPDSYSFTLKEKLFRQWVKKYTLSKIEASLLRIITGDNSRHSTFAHVSIDGEREILQSPSRPRTIMAANDVQAFSILNAAGKLGIRVPEDLEIIGVDNTFLSRICSSVNVVDLRMEEVGAMAAELYLEIQKDPGGNHQKAQIIPSRFISRQSGRIFKE